MTRELWTRDEFLVTLDLYFNEDGFSLAASDPRIQEVAGIIGRSPGAVVGRLSNYRALDPSVPQQGYSNTGKPCRKIWEEYCSNPDELSRDARSAWTRLEEGVVEGGNESETSQVETGESTGEAGVREGQSDFRSAVFERYNGQCAVCDIAEPGLLQAGHILRWSEYEEERGDVSNGLLLCNTHHKAFDAGMFTLSSSHELVVRPDFSPISEYLRQTLLNRNGDEIVFPGEAPSSEYLERRNECLYWWPPEEE